ncbi:MAG: DnaD domain protein [Clostridia bacterium]|nr:DnaD domain protein [Clostridia bacterium]
MENVIGKERTVIGMQIEWNYGNRVMCLPYACVPYLAKASADELRVLLALAAQNTCDAEAAARASGLPAERVSAALAFWEGVGVLRTDGEILTVAAPVGRDRPTYTGPEMEQIAETSDIRELIDVCQAILGDIFTSAESEILFYLYDHLRLPFEYVVRLCKYCTDIGKPSLAYLETVGRSLYDRGIITVEALEIYIEKEEKKGDMEYRVRTLCGFGERVLTAKEQEYLSVWSTDWALPLEVIELGYNEMMRTIPLPKLSYLNGILKKWVEADCRTRESVESYLAKESVGRTGTSGKKKKKQEPSALGFDLDEFFEASLIRGEDSET